MAEPTTNAKVYGPSHKCLGLYQYWTSPAVRRYGPEGQLMTWGCACGCVGLSASKTELHAYEAARATPQHSTRNPARRR